MQKLRNVAEYISRSPKQWQARLKAFRSAVLAAAPKAEERISYGMPYYYYKGRLLYFQLWSRHIGLYALAAPVLKQHKFELEGRLAAKGTVRFPLDEALPVALVKRLVRAQVKYKDQLATNK